MPMTPEQRLEYIDGKVNALAQIVMELARDAMTPEHFRRTVLPILERLEDSVLPTNASEAHLLGIRAIRGWVEEQSAPPTPPSQSPKTD